MQIVSNTASVAGINPELKARLDFLMEADRLKTIIRGSRISDGSRNENVAEHSWHIALFALVLSPHAADPVNPLRVVTMLLIHDLVEIDCGDTPLFDEAGAATQGDREKIAADRLYGLLPHADAKWLRALWDEFEAGQSPDARFAKAIDRFQPILLNHAVGGGTWRDYDVDEDRERSLTRRIAAGSSDLWDAAQAVIANAVCDGMLKPSGR